MSKKAKIVSKSGSLTPNGRERIWELRAGEKGTGQILGSVRFWPWSDKSVEAAERVMIQAAERAGAEIVRDYIWND